MEAWQERVVTEKKELDEKLTRLQSFLSSDIFGTLPRGIQSVMTRQANAMYAYSEALRERIENF